MRSCLPASSMRGTARRQAGARPRAQELVATGTIDVRRPGGLGPSLPGMAQPALTGTGLRRSILTWRMVPKQATSGRNPAVEPAEQRARQAAALR